MELFRCSPVNIVCGAAMDCSTDMEVWTLLSTTLYCMISNSFLNITCMYIHTCLTCMWNTDFYSFIFDLLLSVKEDGSI